MLPNVCQHAIPVGMGKIAELTLVIFTTPGWLIHSGIASGGMASLGMTTMRKGFTEGPGDGGLSGSGDDLADGWIKVGTI